ncbi:leucine-rich repeat protein, putative [Bodo saltans]|uniref:Leucine-rich repeat protein, putative n=1 Tax=Bodo saltans TaxID=75058 RepID=A0A0S4IK39_BODSA|nr:leucine-rich repeat protein, putative [Bodo saltans]|eukprot:CUF01429.1 leucine-rich repeat protein, putative [Bodo saltans]
MTRRESVRDPRSRNARMLEKLQDLRERLADSLSEAMQAAVIDSTAVMPPPDANAHPSDSDAPPAELAAPPAHVEHNEEQLVNTCLDQLELMGFDVSPQALLVGGGGGDGEGITAGCVASYMESLIQSVTAALEADLEWVEAYSADSFVTNDDESTRPQSAMWNLASGDINAARIAEALQELEDFTFSNANDNAAKRQGSAAFRTRAKDFPFFMFPIDSVCSRLDALDELQEQYEAAIRGHEFFLVPECVDGRACRLQDVPEHRLERSHPCFSTEVPCPHRHRALHMKCYAHPEDRDPEFDVRMKSLQRRIGVLELTGVELGDAGAQCISHVLLQDRQREGKAIYSELHMAGNHMSPGGGISVLHACSHLVHVDLSGNALGYKTVALMQTSAVGPALQALLARSERLLTLNLSRNRLSDRDGRYIAEGLKTNTTLRHLDLRKNDLGATFGSDMASALAENRDLRELLLGWNRLESSGSAMLLQEMKTSSTLELVDLSWTGISDEGAKCVAEMIAGSMALRILSVAHNNIGPEGTVSISKALSPGNKTLQSLDLSFNPIGTKAGCEIVKDLRDNTTLELIDLRCIKAGDEVAEEIKRLIKIREPKMASQGLKMTVMFSTSVVGGGGPSGGRQR